MYMIRNLSFTAAALLCLLVTCIVGALSYTIALIMACILIAAVAAENIVFKTFKRKTYLTAAAVAVITVWHMAVARANLVDMSDMLIGVFVLFLNIVIAVSYFKDHTLGNSPIFHDAVFGKQAGEIAACIQGALTLMIIHSLAYAGNVNYTIGLIVFGSLLAVVLTQIIISPKMKKYRTEEKEMLKNQIKKEQGYR